MLRRVAETGIDMILAEPPDCYPSEHFLSCCDELGIALAIKVIQPRASRNGPGEQLIRREISRSLKRFVAHPSVLVLFGGGEFSDIFRQEAAEALPGVLYLEEGIAKFKTPPSLPTDYTSRTYLGVDDMNLTSPTLRARGEKNIEELMRAALEDYRLPHSYGEWTYLSELISAEVAADLLHRARASRSGMGVCIADLSEPVPSLTPSVLDYSGRVKAAYYYLVRCASTTGVYAVADGTKISFYGVNMESVVYKSRLNYAIISNENRGIVRDSVTFAVEPGRTALIYEYDAADIVRAHEREYYLSYSATDTTGTHSRATLLFAPPSRFKFKKPSITAEISGSASEYTVTLYSDVFAKGVEIWIDGDEDAVLEDNFIDITSDVPVRLRLTTARPTAIESLKRELRVRSLYDVGR